jgi:hypothetical protein
MGQFFLTFDLLFYRPTVCLNIGLLRIQELGRVMVVDVERGTWARALEPPLSLRNEGRAYLLQKHFACYVIVASRTLLIGNSGGGTT